MTTPWESAALAGILRADVSAETIGVVIALVLAAFKWLSDKAQEAKATPPSAPKAPAQDEPIRPRSVPREKLPEEERMRKFMEALGLPQDAASPIPPREAPTLRPAPQQPAPARPPDLRPVPPIVSQPAFPRPRTRRPPQLPPMPAPVRGRSLDEASAPTKPVEQIYLEPLQTAEVPSFHTVSSVVSAIPFESSAMENAEMVPAENRVATEARVLLRSPRAMRSAVLLREILGPPRGLQTGPGTHPFPAR